MNSIDLSSGIESINRYLHVDWFIVLVIAMILIAFVLGVIFGFFLAHWTKEAF